MLHSAPAPQCMRHVPHGAHDTCSCPTGALSHQLPGLNHAPAAQPVALEPGPEQRAGARLPSEELVLRHAPAAQLVLHRPRLAHRRQLARLCQLLVDRPARGAGGKLAQQKRLSYHVRLCSTCQTLS